MTINDFRHIFIVCNLILVFLALTPILNLLNPLYLEESFSELSILGPDGMAKNYPFDIVPNHEEHVFVMLKNQMKQSAYYKILVKFRNQSQFFPSQNQPSSLNTLYEFRFFLLDGESWTDEVKFNVLETIFDEDTIQIKKIMINNAISEINSFSRWDSENTGFFFQMFFELWLYNEKLHDFNFCNQGCVGIWLNVTSNDFMEDR